MFPRATICAFVLLVTVVLGAKAPCDSKDPTSLCLKPLRRSDRVTTDSRTTIPSGLIRKSGRGGGRGGLLGAAGLGGLAGVAVGSRRPRRGRGSGGGDDEELFETDEGDDDDDDDFCFPANAVVTVKNVGSVKMADLNIGDTVRAAGGAYSPVYMFSHRLTRGKFPFIKFTTEHGQLTASKGHYVYANGHLVTAATVRKGHTLELANGHPSTVTHVENVVEQGLYNPHTLVGELVVDGFRVSAFTKTVEPIFAESMLAPLRAVFRIFGIDLTAGSMSSTAPSFLLNLLPKGSAFTRL